MKYSYSIIASLGTISSRIDAEGNRWNRELNIISWNHKEPVFDIREWPEDRTTMRNGMMLQKDELLALYKLIQDYMEKTEMR